MITRVIIGILIIGFALVVIDSAEGLVNFKKYKVINSPNVCGDKLCSEIDERIAKKGESSRNIKVCGDRVCSDFSEKPKPINKSSPFGQLKLGIAIDLIQCKEEQGIVIKKTNQTPACVNSENIKKLREKGWAISEQMQQEIFAKIVSNRMLGIESSKILEDFDVTMTITPEEINNQRYLLFEGEGWHRLHNVEITISEGYFSESVRSKTNNRGGLHMLWPIPDVIGGKIYNIFATDKIHQFEIDIPISRVQTKITQPISFDRCSKVTFPINWSGCDLYGKIISHVDLRMANLKGANLFGVTLTGQDVRGADFSGASLKKGNLDAADLRGADFSYANLVDTKVRGADLSNAKFHYAKLYRTDFTKSNLTNADFQDATLSHSNLSFTDLKGANLDRAGTWSANLNSCINHPICN